MNEFTNNDKLLQAIKEYFNDFFDEQEKKFQKIEERLIEVHKIVELIDKNQDFFSIATGKKLQEQNDLLQSLIKYVRDLARYNGWKLPEKQKKPDEVE